MTTTTTDRDAVHERLLALIPDGDVAVPAEVDMGRDRTLVYALRSGYLMSTGTPVSQSIPWGESEWRLTRLLDARADQLTVEHARAGGNNNE